MSSTFSFIDWIKQKFEDEKERLGKINSKIKSTWKDVKEQIGSIDNSHHMIPILNGIMGDTFAEKGSDYLVDMSFRFKSRDVDISDLEQFYDFLEYNGKVIIMVHGLMNDESIWQAEYYKDKRMGGWLEKKSIANILYIRYNTGIHISENGKALSNLLQSFVEKHSDKINELIMIGHSMGGLTTRSAGYYATLYNQSWTKLLTKVFLLGVPNEGSYLARIGYMTQYFFRKLDPSDNDVVAKFFDRRSNGIKDLSFGYMVDDDWQSEKDGNEKDIIKTKVPPLPNVKYYLIAATIENGGENNWFKSHFGDLLVEEESAISETFISVSDKSGNVYYKLFPDLNHLTMLESDVVFEYIEGCFS